MNDDETAFFWCRTAGLLVGAPGGTAQGIPILNRSFSNRQGPAFGCGLVSVGCAGRLDASWWRGTAPGPALRTAFCPGHPEDEILEGDGIFSKKAHSQAAIACLSW